ncbi:MAG: BrnT family toxin [Gemmatimonadaceae bacterium]
MPDVTAILASAEGFDWDQGNTTKDVLGHDVSPAEAEEIFFRAPVLVFDDTKHSERENRLLLYGSTRAGRCLTAAFTLRNKRIRVISVRDMSRKERRVYEQAR